MSGYMTSALNAPACAESYSAAWDRAHEIHAAEDAIRSAALMEMIKRDIRAERARQSGLGGRPRTNPDSCTVCGRDDVYAKGMCQAHYRAARRAA